MRSRQMFLCLLALLLVGCSALQGRPAPALDEEDPYKDGQFVLVDSQSLEEDVVPPETTAPPTGDEWVSGNPDEPLGPLLDD